MAPSYEQIVIHAESAKAAQNTSKAIELYESALTKTHTVANQIELCTTLGKLYLKTNDTQQAAEHFIKALHLFEVFSIEQPVEKAILHNNLAHALLHQNTEDALQNYAAALAIFMELKDKNEKYNTHAANTAFAMGEAFMKLRKLSQAKQTYKQAIALYESLKLSNYEEFSARAQYQLGAIYQEENLFLDAKNHFKKAYEYFAKLAYNDLRFEPYQAAACNNLSVCFKDLGMYDEALKYYQKTLTTYTNLSEDNAEFVPYVASTYTAIAILYAQLKNYKTALKNEKYGRRIYEFLTEETPEKYKHYWATSYHNCGVFALEDQNLEKAEKYFKIALKMRKELAKQEKIFEADVCVTALNLLETYQTNEAVKPQNKKEKCLKILSDLEKILPQLNQEKPVVKSMKSDVAYYNNILKTKN
ncbi:MAG: tetratricopeptide repeat protein [Flavobacteriaceae bacterium]|nr:tetratricopeptide repeat protein [Flavobacteriaceae bacterium]